MRASRALDHPNERSRVERGLTGLLASQVQQKIRLARPRRSLLPTTITASASLSSEGFTVCEQSHTNYRTNVPPMDHSHGGRRWLCPKSTVHIRLRIAAT